MISDLIILTAAVAAVAGWRFAVVYHWRTGGDWFRRDNPGGRHVMALTADLAALLTLVAIGRAWPEWPGRHWVTLTLMIGLVYQLVRRNVLMDREQARFDGRKIVTNRPRPVLIYGAVLAVLTVLTTSADAANLVPEWVLMWARLLTAIVVALGGALLVQARVTPVSDPRDDDGTPLLRPEFVPRAKRPETWSSGEPVPPPREFTTGTGDTTGHDPR